MNTWLWPCHVLKTQMHHAHIQHYHAKIAGNFKRISRKIWKTKCKLMPTHRYCDANIGLVHQDKQLLALIVHSGVTKHCRRRGWEREARWLLKESQTSNDGNTGLMILSCISLRNVSSSHHSTQIWCFRLPLFFVSSVEDYDTFHVHHDLWYSQAYVKFFGFYVLISYLNWQ